MTQTESFAEAFPTQFAEMGKKQLEAFAETQKQFWETAGKMNQAWLDQSQSEAALVSEFLNKLAAARSVPDAMAVYQEFMSRQLQMVADSGRRIVDDCGSLVRAFPAARAGNGGMGT
jgi:hypothetical protein